ncbi:hypothetical protein A3850_008215 [Lewinella sp. 4G2]|nr:hypothetical protein A3850_008215 [Lewinella sp. 4G2]
MGPKPVEINDAVADGLDATLDKLFATPVVPAPPVNHFFPDDPYVAVGQTWVNSPRNPNVDVGPYRSNSLRGWYWNHLIDAPGTIMERLAMFWINHFGMSDVGEQRAQYQYIQLFREFGAGSYKEMIEKITVHPAMLRFLNGDYSNKWEPNENYARELLELFTIQKGPQIAPGDYTHYTEQDIKVAARILTGWRNRGMWSEEDIPVESYFFAEWHDDETDPNNPNQNIKQLSEKFGNAIIPNNDENEYKDLIAIIFDQPETARAMCREIYRFFVYYDITDAIEADVIEPLAQHMIDNDFSMESTLRLLFSSEHFYDMAVRGPIIKNPYEYMLSIARPLGGYTHLGLNLVGNENSPEIWTIYNIGRSYHWKGDSLNMDFLYPPTVAGWKAYYQTPNYYRNWISSSMLQERRRTVNSFTYGGLYTQTNDGDYDPRPFDWMGFMEALSNPADVNEVVQESIEIFLPRDLHPDQFDALKDQLLQGQEDGEWTIQWNNYLDSPFDPDTVNPLRNKIKDFYRSLFSMAEFHLQ